MKLLHRMLMIISCCSLTFTSLAQNSFMKGFNNEDDDLDAFFHNIYTTPDSNLLGIGSNFQRTYLFKFTPDTRVLWAKAFPNSGAYRDIEFKRDGTMFLFGKHNRPQKPDLLLLTKLKADGTVKFSKTIHHKRKFLKHDLNIYYADSQSIGLFYSEVDADRFRLLEVSLQGQILEQKVYDFFTNDKVGFLRIVSSNKKPGTFYIGSTFNEYKNPVIDSPSHGVLLKGHKQQLLKVKKFSDEPFSTMVNLKLDGKGNVYLGSPDSVNGKSVYDILKFGSDLESFRKKVRLAVPNFVRSTYASTNSVSKQVLQNEKIYYTLEIPKQRKALFMTMDTAFQGLKTGVTKTGYLLGGMTKGKKHGLYASVSALWNYRTNFHNRILKLPNTLSSHCLEDYPVNYLDTASDIKINDLFIREVARITPEIQDKPITNMKNFSVEDTTICHSCHYEVTLGPDTSLCKQDTIRPVHAPDELAYQWHTGRSTKFIPAKKSGTYRLKGTLEGCPPAIDSMQVSVLPKPQPALTLSGDELKAYDTLHYEDQTPNTASRIWSFGQGDTAYKAEGEFQYRQTGKFPLTLWVKNEAGCNNQTSRFIEVNGRSFYIPEAFSPNNNGLNETFSLKGVGIKHYRLLIYNRWGERLFKGRNEGWNGRFKGRQVPQGRYFYRFTIRLEKRRITRSGVVRLIR